MGGMVGRKRKKKDNIAQSEYIVTLNVAGTIYYMNWPMTDIDPDSPTFGKELSIGEVQEWVWEWIHQGAEENNDVLIVSCGDEARSIRASAVMHVDVVIPRFRIRYG